MLPRRCAAFAVAVIATSLVASAAAQAAVGVPVTDADYAHAEQFLSYNTTPLVFGLTLRPGWLADGRFWYEATTAAGNDYYLVDPARGTREPAFDRARLAAALASASGAVETADALALTNLTFSPDGRSVSFTADRRRWQCDRQGNACAPDNRPAPPELGGRGRGGFGRGGGRGGAPPQSVAPNGKVAVFIRDWNLWSRDLTTHQETQLTTDGVENFGYATDNAGWTSSDRPIVLWSPDSTKIATFHRISAASASCIWCRWWSVIPRSPPKSIRCPATR